MSCSQSALDLLRVRLCVQAKTSAPQRLCHHVALSDLVAISAAGIQPAHARPSGHVVPGVNKAADEQRASMDCKNSNSARAAPSRSVRHFEFGPRTCCGPRQTLAVQRPEVQVSEADVEAAQVQRYREREAFERVEL